MAASGAAAQESKPYNLDDVMTLVQAGVSSTRILSTVKTACISFKMTQSVSDRLRSEGANDALVEGLRSACFRSASDSKESDSRDVRPVKRVTPPEPRIIRKTDTVHVRKVDTVFVPRPVTPTPPPPPAVVPVTPYTPPVTGGATLVDWDFRSSQPLTSGRFGKCQYAYGSGGYTVAVAENGGPCYDGSSTELEPNVRISTVATPVGGNGGYTYGVRFGVSDDSTIGYYALEISALGHYELSRYRNRKWEVLFPWSPGTGINASTAGLANNIVVEIRGSQLTFIINGIQQRTFTADAPVRGRAGFGIFGYGDDPPWPSVTFANFRETSLSAPTTTVTPVTPSIPSTTGGSTLVDWDFRSSQPLTSGRFGKCQYDYGSGGYTVAIAENGGPCYDGSSTELEPNVRISTIASPVGGNGGYTYGIRFGVSDDSTIGYYALEVSALGHFELSRYRMHKWEVLFPWDNGTGIHAATTGLSNTIVVEVRGSQLTFIINGIQQRTFTADAPVRGRAGFGIFGYGDDPPWPRVSFSSFREQSLYSPQPTTLSSSNAVDWDFRSVQPLTTGRFGKCQYDYTSGGYTISVAENGTTCIDGPLGDQPASVRISTTATPVRGTGGYTYGIRFGYTSDSTIGYYAFEISIGGSFQLSRYRMNRWEPLIPWQKSPAIRSGEGNSNTLTVDVRGTFVTLYINDTQVGTYQTPLQPIGPAGFGIIGYPEGVPYPMVTFSRFSVGPI